MNQAEFETLATGDGLLDYAPGFAGDHDSNWFHQLRRGIAWEQEVYTVFGREVTSPRLVAFAGEPGISYRYSGLDHIASGWPSILPDIHQRVEAASGEHFNCVLLNFYRSGQDSMGWHSDDEPTLGRNPVVASLSLGACRDFLIRRKGQKAGSEAIALASGSLLLMRGNFQHAWQHSLPKRARVSSPRINLTFRRVVNCG